MKETYFFDLPVYRLARDEYYEKEERIVSDQISYISNSLPGYQIPEITVMGINDRQHKKHGPWDFNEIIGYIRLFFLGTQIRGEYFSAEKKRNPLSRYKVFTLRALKLAPEITISSFEAATNDEIFEIIKEYISDCKNELKNGRVIDDKILMNIGPHIDWRSLLK